MKKTLILFAAVMIATMNVNAQESRSKWTLNTRSWSTNYFTCALGALTQIVVSDYIFKDSPKDSILAERLLPAPDLVFPIGMGKDGFSSTNDIYGPYHRAFSNPIKHAGDYAIGLDASYKPAYVGFYAGAYFKSQEVVSKVDDRNIRGFYIQPRCGIILGHDKRQFEAGVFYDVLTGCGGDAAGVEKDMLKGGAGLDFAFSRLNKNGKSRFLLQFSMPLHNFFNQDYPGQQNLKRRVGYIMLTERIYL